MQRRKFIQQLSAITGGVFLLGNTAFARLTADSKKIKGRVLVDGRGLQHVVVSDGYSVIATDKKGRFEIEANPGAVNIFISTPAGFEFLHEKNITRHYQSISLTEKNNEIVFELQPLSGDDYEHDFIIWADPQVKNEKDVKKMMTESVPAAKKTIAEAGEGKLIHGITVGDIVWDTLSLFDDYGKAVGEMNIPFFQCLGNHDMDYNKGGDEASDDTFQKVFGPTYYSFNRGKAHYVVMDNVRYLGRDREYDGFIQQQQLDWLAKDLSFVDNNRLIILCVHIPIHLHTKNKEALYKILGARNVHIMSGHTHFHQNVINGNIYEHNHGTVCGAWWTGSICEDGTPNGYGVYQVKGNELSWHYQSTGEHADHQMKAYFSDISADTKLLQVNIWNHDQAWRTQYFLDGKEMGELTQFEGIDPLAYNTLLGPDLPKPRGFAEPKLTTHLFKAEIPASTREVKIIATDRFGKEFITIEKVV